MKNLSFSEFIELDIQNSTYKKIKGSLFFLFVDVEIHDILEYPLPFKIHILLISYEHKNKNSLILITESQYQCYKKNLSASDLVVDKSVSDEEWRSIQDYFGKTSQLNELFQTLDSLLRYPPQVEPVR